ncbi:hypothetical protein LTS18_010926, partial [Coniosporium uncinatum]
ACESALAHADSYNHSQTQTWNETIINKTLQSLISESPPPSGRPSHKYIVNSVIIQHTAPTSSSSSSSTAQQQQPTQAMSPPPESSSSASGTNDSTGAGRKTAAAAAAAAGRRGMHAAAGAYWNNETDGMWSYKFEGAEGKGMDVVVSVMWIAI